MLPRYITIKSALLDAIESGELQPGDQIDSENQLALRYKVSRMTARRAMTELVEEGILARSQGLGTFVSDSRPMSSMLKIVGVQEEIRSRGHQYQARLLVKDKIFASEQQSKWLGVAPGAELYFTRVVHYENQVAVQLEERLVSPVWAPDYLQQDFNKVTANEYLNLVAPLTEADHIVEAMLPSDTDADVLEIPLQQPCLRITRRTYSARGIVSFALLTHPGNRYRLGGHLQFDAPVKELKK
ncbi:UTRA domain-containing protein [Alteromonas pelagimontana]|uniref:UTRA domain-containing protein n=1 Tax=Alteromonas pelagimontana TaxID=1858656 RepID=A0A6M4MH44_9ALTE|nr:UTRA domain-containing protein [Alteromonas pelagimontana]QJR82534.1 UTRA domain-containing protein [Alteromonas pelagimontana]